MMHDVNIARLTSDQVSVINKYEAEFTKKYGEDIVLIAIKQKA